MIHLSRQNHFDFPIFTLDTGLLFRETLVLKRALQDFFGVSIECIEADLTVQEQANTFVAEL